MNKAVARHALRQAGWRESEITMAERILRHDGSRRSPQVLTILQAYAERQTDDGEREAWERLTHTIEADPSLADAVVALLAL